MDVDRVARAVAEFTVFRDRVAADASRLDSVAVGELHVRYGLLREQLVVAEAAVRAALPRAVPPGLIGELLWLVRTDSRVRRDLAWVRDPGRSEPLQHAVALRAEVIGRASSPLSGPSL